MAFTYTVSGTTSLGGAKMVRGTWSAASVTEGNIPFGGIRGSVALTTTTASNTTLTTSGSYTTSQVHVGDIITGTGIPVGTYVASIESATSLTMSAAATDGTAGSRTFTRLMPPVGSIITAKVVNSVSATTMTAAKVVSVNNSLALTCVSGDSGWFSVILE